MFYFFGGLLLWYCLIFVYKTKTGSPSVMSKREHIKKLVKYVKPGMKVADMGGGDGQVLLAMVEAGAKAGEGWEIEPLVWIKAQREIQKAGRQGQVKIHFGDMWKADLSQYDLLYVYQLTRYAPKLVKKCKQEMKRGAVVIANTYPLQGLSLRTRDGKLFVYQI